MQIFKDFVFLCVLVHCVSLSPGIIPGLFPRIDVLKYKKRLLNPWVTLGLPELPYSGQAAFICLQCSWSAPGGKSIQEHQKRAFSIWHHLLTVLDIHARKTIPGAFSIALVFPRQQRKIPRHHRLAHHTLDDRRLFGCQGSDLPYCITQYCIMQ